MNDRPTGRSPAVLDERVLEALPGCAMIFEADGVVEAANAEARRFLELGERRPQTLSLEDWAGRVLDTDGRELPIDEFPATRALRGETVAEITVGLRRSDGDVAWAVARAAPLPGESGSEGRAIVTFLDVTGLKRAAAELIARRDQVRRVQKLARVGSWVWDLETNTSHWDDEMYELTGLSRDEFTGGPEVIARLVHPEDLERFMGVMENIQAGGGPRAIEHRIVRGDGEVRVIWVEGELQFDGSGRPVRVLGAVQDITAHKEAENTRRTLEEQLRRAQQLEGLGTLAGGIAHDFNNLLHVILGNTRHALGHASLPHELEPMLADIRESVEQATRRVRSLLALGRRQHLEPVDLELNGTVGRVLSGLRDVIGSHIGIEFVPGHDPGHVRFDPDQLRQVLFNLCANARDAMPDGGRITVATHRSAAADFPDDGVPAGDHAVIEVSDEGPGIPEELRDAVFEPFFTTKDAGQGSGLGLPVAYGVVKQHGGDMRLANGEGGGASFLIYLPIIEPQPPEPASAPDVEPQRSGRLILVVDDEARVRRLLRRVLANTGFDVVEAADGVEALERFDEYEEEIALVVLDVAMPRMGGREVFEKIRTRRGDLPVLFSSGYDVDRSLDGLAGFRPEMMLPKPYTPDQLLSRVHALLRPSQQPHGR